MQAEGADEAQLDQGTKGEIKCPLRQLVSSCSFANGTNTTPIEERPAPNGELQGARVNPVVKDTPVVAVLFRFLLFTFALVFLRAAYLP